MAVTRRKFLLDSTYASAGFAVIGAMKPIALLAQANEKEMAPYLTGIRMAATPATNYRAYRSKVVATPDVTTWVQVDLKKVFQSLRFSYSLPPSGCIRAATNTTEARGSSAIPAGSLRRCELRKS
ncbi:hypothetical protein [Tunturiibacter gelidiferens]|uniref:hypothetical protein n=1 Tax=Tunturiibacter gelidiferens TaxID=3069689 RepID=UPI003D9B2861